MESVAMTFDAHRDHRRSIRFAGYDYRAVGAYFVTVCASRRGDIFGKIENGAVTLNAYGRIIGSCWCDLPNHSPNVILDVSIIMPDHFHGIIIITDANTVGARPASPNADAHNKSIFYGDERARQASPLRSGSLGAIVGSFKSAVTRRINAHRDAQNRSPVQVWQRNYYERIIRDENELNETRRYISENPSRPRDDA